MFVEITCIGVLSNQYLKHFIVFEEAFCWFPPICYRHFIPFSDILCILPAYLENLWKAIFGSGGGDVWFWNCHFSEYVRTLYCFFFKYYEKTAGKFPVLKWLLFNVFNQCPTTSPIFSALYILHCYGSFVSRASSYVGHSNKKGFTAGTIFPDRKMYSKFGQRSQTDSIQTVLRYSAYCVAKLGGRKRWPLPGFCGWWRWEAGFKGSNSWQNLHEWWVQLAWNFLKNCKLLSNAKSKKLCGQRMPLKPINEMQNPRDCLFPRACLPNINTSLHFH